MRHSARIGRKLFMHVMTRRGVVIGICGGLLFCAALGLRGGANAGQEKEKAASARKMATKANPAVAYRFNTLGVAHMNQQRPADAQKYFQQALEADPKFAVARLNLGVALLGQQKLDSARAAQRKGDATAAREHLARFQKITSEHLGTPFGAGYGDQGKFSTAELPLSAVSDVPAAIAAHFAVETNPFVSEGKSGSPFALGASTGACFFDFDGDGKPDLFLVSGTADGESHLLRNLGNGRFEDVTQTAGIQLRGTGFGCAAGDFDNDGKPDLAVCLSDGVRLLHNRDEAKFEDVTEAAGIRKEKGCVGATFVDYDHDSDLDLYVTMGADSGSAGMAAHNLLWRNNGNSTFTDVSAETALGVAATGAGVVTTDFNNDRAIDFVVAGGTAGASIYLNPREGKFTPLGGIDFSKEKLPPAAGGGAFDSDKDGWLARAFGRP